MALGISFLELCRSESTDLSALTRPILSSSGGLPNSPAVGVERVPNSVLKKGDRHLARSDFPCQPMALLGASPLFPPPVSVDAHAHPPPSFRVYWPEFMKRVRNMLRKRDRYLAAGDLSAATDGSARSQPPFSTACRGLGSGSIVRHESNGWEVDFAGNDGWNAVASVPLAGSRRVMNRDRPRAWPAAC